MIVWNHWLNGREFEQTPGDSEGQNLECCCPWSWKIHTWVCDWTITKQIIENCSYRREVLVLNLFNRASIGIFSLPSLLCSNLNLDSQKHGGSAVKNLPAKLGDAVSVSVLGRCPGEGNDNLLQYSCLGSPMDRGAWQATVHGVIKSQTWLSDYTTRNIIIKEECCGRESDAVM